MTVFSLEKGQRLISEQRAAKLTRWVSPICVLGACLFVFWQLRPDLMFSSTTPSGGDMGAHIWGPSYLREHLLATGRLSGWSPDWYGGFPVYRFYMVLPALAIALLSYVIPYGVAFKLVSVLGLISLPLAAAIFVRLAGLRFPAPTLAALFTLPFLFDWSYSTWGGNISSTLAGEYSFSISLSLALVYLGVVLRGLRSGRHRVLAGVLLALTGLSHLIPAIFATVATILAFLFRPGRGRLRWLIVVGALAAILPAFWLLPFWVQRKYYFNIDWLNESIYWDYLVRSDWNAVYVLAWVGLLVGVMRKERLALFLSALTVICAAGYRWLPQNALWNSRIIPFYYICLMLLAALGLSLLLRSLVKKAPLTSPPVGDEPGGHRTFLENLGLRLTRRKLVPLAALVPVLSLVVSIDDVLPSSVLKATIRGVLSVPDDEAKRLAGQVSHLAILILVASLIVILVELISTLRVRGMPRWHPVMLDVSSLSVAGPASRRGRRGGSRFEGGKGYGLPLAVLGSALVLICVVAYPLRALGFAGHTDSRGNYGLHLGPDWVLVGSDWVPFGRPRAESRPASEGEIGTHCEGERRVRGDSGRTRDAISGEECGRGVNNHVGGWVEWNFAGYEMKQPRSFEVADEMQSSEGYKEYYRVVSAMGELGESRGCGRVMWEYEKERLNSYGTPMSLMLLPHWTEGCMASMEGLFFEGTLSVPFHFVNQDELSRRPSRPVRAVSYTGVNLDSGVEHMQLYGVSYYMAVSDSLIATARNHPDLIEVASEHPWVVFEVADSRLAEPLRYEPVVVEGSGESAETWLDISLPFYAAYQRPAPGVVNVFPADNGPEDWRRVRPAVDESDGLRTEQLPDLPTKTLQDIEVTNIQSSRDSIKFSVSEPGVPVLIKTSYFPNWRADGALGPYRVAPNLMAVVPSGTNVELRYSWSLLEVISYTLSGIGVVLAFVLWRTPGFWPSERRREDR